MSERLEYLHDGSKYSPSWVEWEQDWDADRKCYRTVIRTNDTTDHARLPSTLRWLYERTNKPDQHSDCLCVSQEKE